MKLDVLKSLEQQYMQHTYGRMDVSFISGKGATLIDVDGKEYIDLASGIGVMSLGYSDEKWVAAVTEQAAKIAHLSNYFYHENYLKVAEKLCNISGLEGGVFFGNSGAEANEGAIKAARKYSFDKYGQGRSVILTMKGSFHGRTVTTLAATGQDVFHNYFYPFTEGFRYVMPNDVSNFEDALRGDVCAIIMEPILGESGVVPLDYGYVKSVCKTAAERDILVIFDEVQTGMGRTGKIFAYQNFCGVVPDIITLAKGLGGGLPIGAFVVGKKLADTLGASMHGSTFGGNPIVCAGANAVLDRLVPPGFLEQVAEKGEYITEKLKSIDNIELVRGKGLMIGFKCKGAENKAVAKKLLENGVVVITAGDNIVRLLPPLVITKEEIDKALAVINSVLS